MFAIVNLASIAKDYGEFMIDKCNHQHTIISDTQVACLIIYINPSIYLLFLVHSEAFYLFIYLYGLFVKLTSHVIIRKHGHNKHVLINLKFSIKL